MKKLISVIVALTMVLCSASSAFACAGIYVGNDAAENGSTYFARSEDFGYDYTKVFGVAPSRNIGDEDVYEDAYGFKMAYSEFGLTGDTHKYTYIKDSPEQGESPVSPADGEAYAEAGINDSGVFVSATVSTNYMATWHGTDCASMDADPLVETGICEISLGSILLAHSGTAKEGVDLLAKIIDKYGAGECNSLTIGDQNETWYFEIVSGHQYAAVKMPKDNSVAIQPNIMLLGVIDVTDTENVVASKNLVSLAQEKGFLVTDKDGKIDVAKSYAEVNSGAAQYQRYYQGLFYINKEEALKYDGVLDRDKLTTFNNNTDGLPFMNTPDRKLSTMDIFKLQATRGEGSKFDANKTDSYAIGNENQSECHVFETRKDMVPQLATIQWQAMGPAEYSIYIPYYSALISNVYGLYDVESTESVDYSMFWVFSNIYQLCSKDRTNNGAAVKAYFEKYQESLIEQQKTVDTEMAALYEKDPDAAAEMADMLGMDLAQQTYKIASKVLDELEAYDAQEEKDAPMVLSESITGFMPVYSTEHASAPAVAKVKPTVSLAKGTTRGIKVTVTVPEAQKADKTGMIIYRSKSKDSGYVMYKKVAVKGSTYSITNTKDAKGNYLTEGTRYYYKAKAYAVIDGNTYYGPMSDVKSLTPKITDVKATVSLSTKNISRGIKVTVKVPETQKAEKKGFIIYRSTKKNSGYVKYKTADTRNASYSIVNTKNAAGNRLVKGKTYYYKVKTYKVVNGKKYYGTMSPVKYIKAK